MTVRSLHPVWQEPGQRPIVGEGYSINTRVKSAVEKDILMVRKIILAMALSGIALSATACNTVKGVGRDVESVGEAGDKAIR